MSMASVEFFANKQDWRHEMLAYKLSSHQLANLMLADLAPLVVLLAVVGVRDTSQFNPFILSLPFSALGALLAYSYFAEPIRTANRRSQNGAQQAKVLFDISEEGVQIKNADMELKYHWQCFNRAVITEDFYFLVYTGNRDAYHFIPRRVFASEAAEGSFRAILEANLPDVQVKPIRQRRGWVNLIMGTSGVIYFMVFMVTLIWLIR